MTKKTRFFIPILLLSALLLVMGLLSIPAATFAEGAGKYDYSTTTVFTIESQADAELFLSIYGSPIQSLFNGKTIELKSDIDCSGSSFTWTSFSGTFRGNGHTLKNKTKPLFTTLELQGKVSDLKFAQFNGSGVTAAVAVTNKGTVENVTLTGRMAAASLGGAVYTNNGTVDNVKNFMELTTEGFSSGSGVGGLVHTNSGTVKNSHFMGSLTLYNNVPSSGGIAASNGSLGKINGCSAVADITVLTSTVPNVLPKIGYAVGVQSGTVTGSYFIGSVSPYSYEDGGTVAYTPAFSNSGSGTYSNCYYHTAAGSKVYSALNTAFIPLSDSFTENDFDGLLAGAEFLFVDGIYPIHSTLLSGTGSVQDPFLVRTLSELLSLKIFANARGAAVNVRLAAEIDAYGAKGEMILSGMAFSMHFEGNGLAVKNLSGDCLFAQDGAGSISVSHLGVFHSQLTTVVQGIADPATVYREGEVYSFDYAGKTEGTLVKQSLSGLGAADNPYLIGNREQLLSISDYSTGYFALTNDILVNAPIDTEWYRLGLLNRGVVLDGRGFSIVGLIDEPLFSENAGTVRHLTLRGYQHQCLSAFVVGRNTGTVSNVVVYGTSEAGGGASVAYQNEGEILYATNHAFAANGTQPYSGIAKENSGSIRFAENYVEVDYGMTQDNTGTVSDSMDFDGRALADTLSGITNVIEVKNTVNLVYGGVRYENAALDAISIGENYPLLDTDTVFGYSVNVFLPYPVLRKNHLRYKSQHVGVLSAVPFITREYNADTVYYTGNIELGIATEAVSPVHFTWRYDNAPMIATQFSDVGVYEVTAYCEESAMHLPATRTQTMTITQAVFSAGMVFSEGSFSDLTTPYIGDEIFISAPVPSNITDLLSNGFSTVTQLTKDGGTAAEVYQTGTYSQTITATSKNYKTLTAQRTVTVTPCEVKIQVSDATINYLESFSGNGTITVLEGLVGDDIGADVSTLLAAHSYTSNYTAGSPTDGEYSISFTGSFLNYTVSDMTKGRLTVLPIPFTDAMKGEIGFTDAVLEYTGVPISLTPASLPAGVSVVYGTEGNSYKNASDTPYSVSAVFSKKNYIDWDVTKTLTITRKALALTVKNISEPYGTAVLHSAFGCTTTGLAGQDTLAQIFLDSTFVYTVTSDGMSIPPVEGSYLLPYGTYTVALAVDGGQSGTLTNYDYTVTAGILSVNKASLKKLYPVHADGEYTYNGCEYPHTIIFFEDYGIAPQSIQYVYTDEGDNVLSAAPADTGVYRVTATVPPIDSNYTATDYTYQIVIEQATIFISFPMTEYEEEYAAVGYGTAENFPYEGALPDGIAAVFSCLQGVVDAEGRAAGTYTLRYQVAESKNYKGITITATLRVTEKPITLTLQKKYPYNGGTVLPIVTDISGGLLDEVVAGSFTYTYRKDESTVTRMSTVGLYEVTAFLNNENYCLNEAVFSLEVERLEIFVDVAPIVFTYGTAGSYTYGGINYNITRSNILRYLYLVEATGQTVTLTYNIAEYTVGKYDITSILSTENLKFTVSQASIDAEKNTLTVEQCPLSAVWTFDGFDIGTSTYLSQYDGASQTARFGFRLGAGSLASWDVESDIDIRQSLREGKTDIYSVGAYILTLSLYNNGNYKLIANDLTVTVTKAPLSIAVQDATVEAGLSYSAISYTATGRRGADITKSIYELAGADVKMVTGYYVGAGAGSTFTIGINATFDNYVATVTRTGTLTVIANPYKTLTISDKTVVYNGAAHSIYINETPESGVTVTYRSNGYTEVGTYQIYADIVYPAPRPSRTIVATLRILKCTPTLTLQEMSTVYTENRVLLDSEIKGNAYLPDTNISVAGVFRFSGAIVLEEGRKTDGYNVTFFPTDTHNFSSIGGSYYINAVVISDSSLIFSPLEVIVGAGVGFLELKGEVTVTLNVSMSGLFLYRNDVRTAGSLKLRETETVVISVQYNGTTVFSVTYSVTNKEEKEQHEDIVISVENMLEFYSGLTYRSGVIYTVAGGRFSLKEAYREQFSIYVDNMYTSECIINGDEGEIMISFRSKDGKTIYRSVAVRIEQTKGSDNNPSKTNYSLIFGLIGGGAAVVIVIFLVVGLIRRRKN